MQMHTVGIFADTGDTAGHGGNSPMFTSGDSEVDKQAAGRLSLEVC